MPSSHVPANQNGCHLQCARTEEQATLNSCSHDRPLMVFKGGYSSLHAYRFKRCVCTPVFRSCSESQPVLGIESHSQESKLPGRTLQHGHPWLIISWLSFRASVSRWPTYLLYSKAASHIKFAYIHSMNTRNAVERRSCQNL